METFDYRKYTWLAGILALVCISFGALAFGVSAFKEAKYPNGQPATITVSGEGEVTAPPDVATVTVTIREDAKTVPSAQKEVEDKVTKAIESLSALGVSKEDTKTLSYTVNPKYESQQIYCITTPCYSGKTVIVGYEVSQTIQIKVRKIESSGEVIGALGSANITEISGPEFTVDDIEKVKAEAKKLAIKDAKMKAKDTARSLHVGLGDIVQFNEDNGGYYPIMYKAEAAAYGMGGDGNSVTLPQGESVIKMRVTITYALD